jgi:hypothetical protein
MNGMTALQDKQPAVETDGVTIRRLDTARLRFFYNGATLRLTLDQECSFPKVSVARAFPFSAPTRFLSVQDGQNKEIGMIWSLDQLDEENRLVLQRELERRYVIPLIEGIVSAKDLFGFVEWNVVTSKGPTRFTTRHLHEHTVKPSPGRYILTDTDGNRYEIQDIERLGDKSRALFLRHL